MTKIRKINVSQVEGNDANNTDITEIRPFGETAFYLDTNGNTDKLVLMMFDGIKTHQKSKILSPGVLYGSNADSGDGAGLDTIKLIPDSTLHYDFNNYNNHQHLIIDPTAPNHIHIRAGGPIDNSNADLFLGGELTHVKVSDGYDNVVIRTSIVGEGITERNWTFGADGTLTFPDLTASLGSKIVASIDDYYAITTQRYQQVTATTTAGTDPYTGQFELSELSINLYEVQAGWEMNTGTEQSPIWTTVTNASPNPGEYWIYLASGFDFQFAPSTVYTFRNPIQTGSTWQFGEDGTLTLPGNIVTLEVDDAEASGGLVVSVDTGIQEYTSLYKFGRSGQFTSRAITVTDANGVRVGGVTGDGLGPILNAPSGKEVWVSTNGNHLWRFTADSNFVLPPNGDIVDSNGTSVLGSRVVSAPVSSIGAAGDKQGDLAFDGSYMYYCTQDFAAEPYSTTIVLTYTGLYPDIVKGSIPQPQAGWAFVHNGTTYTLASDAVENNPGEWNCELTTSISVTAGDTVTLGPVFSADIWKRIAWSTDTW